MEIPRTARNVEPYSLSNDEHGYLVYGFVLYASQEQRDAVQAVRDAVKVRRSMLPAHVTVKGPICDVPSIDAVQAAVDEVAPSTEPLEVGFDGRPYPKTTQNGEVIGLQSIVTSPELVDVHSRLIEALNPVSATAYFGEKDGIFSPHLTVYHEPEPELEQHGESLLQELAIGDGFTADRISFSGHVGRPFRGEWKLLSEHRLGGN